MALLECDGHLERPITLEWKAKWRSPVTRRGARRVCLLFFLIWVYRFMLTASGGVFYDRATLLQLSSRLDFLTQVCCSPTPSYQGTMEERQARLSWRQRAEADGEELREGSGVWLAKEG